MDRDHTISGKRRVVGAARAERRSLYSGWLVAHIDPTYGHYEAVKYYNRALRRHSKYLRKQLNSENST